MTNQNSENGASRPRGKRTSTKSIVLYPNQTAIVVALAKSERRSFSNAIQCIIERYYAANTADFAVTKPINPKETEDNENGN